MSNKLQSIPLNDMELKNNVTNIEKIDNFNAHVNTVQNNFVFNNSIMIQNTEIRNSGISRNINTSFYNLFIAPCEAITQTWCFTIPKVQALQDTDKNIVKLLTALGEHELEQIRSYPTILTTPNHCLGRTDEQHMAYYGFINGIKINDFSIQFGFTKLHDIPQQILIDSADYFGIKKVSAFNELDRPHWAVKEVNIIVSLRNKGIQVVDLSY